MSKSKSKYDLSSILTELKKSEKGDEKKEFSSDFYKVSLAKDETDLEVIVRFIPNPDSDTSVPWVFRPAHMIKFPNGNFMYEPCPKRAKKDDCPICDEVNNMYQSQNPKLEAIAGRQFAKKRYFHNVLVVKDPRNGGENEGKILIYEYGKQVHDICLEALQDDDEPLVYFDPVEGANFKLKIVKEGEFPTYTKSKFLKASPLEIDGDELDEDEAEEYVSKNAHKLNEKLMSDKVFKSADELRELYDNQGVRKTPAKSTSDDADDEESAEEVISKAKAKTTKKPKDKVAEEVEDDDEDYLASDDEGSDNESDDELRALLADDED
jgi:hypothetical protein